MKHVEVKDKESSVVMTFHYDKDEETLTVRFRSGAVYEYYDVPQSTYDAFVKAESLGQYLNAEIKDVFAYCRVR
jgi:lysyl-tRNA synthetase class 2